MTTRPLLLLAAGFLSACAAAAEPDGSITVGDAVPTIFYKRDARGREFQAAKLSLTSTRRERTFTVVTRMHGAAAYRDFTVGPAGLRDAEILVPPLPEGARDTLRVEVYAGKTLAGAREFPWKFQRRWKLFLAPYCHVDVGYSNTQADVELIHKQNLDGKRDEKGRPVGALTLMAQTDAFPEDSRFRFTAEGSWSVTKFLQDPAIAQARKDELLRRIQEGRLEVGGFYIDHLNKFMGDEALIRSTFFSAEYLARKYGVAVDSAIINDAGDASSVVQPLAKAGIRYFQFGPNSLQFALPPLFWLKPPRNTERILVWRTPNTASYGENTDLYLRPEPPSSPLERHDPDRPVDREKYTKALEEHFTWLQENGLPLPKVKSGYKDMDKWSYRYPYDAYFITYYPAHAGDNGHQDLTPSLIAKEWNETYAYPKIIIATQREFFRYMEREYNNDIPEIPLDFTGYWGEQIFLDDLQIDPGKERASRRFVETMSLAESFSAAALAGNAGFAYPDADAVREMYGRNILNNDHNPAPVPISGNRCPSNSSGICYTDADLTAWKDVRRQWTDEPLAFARTAAAGALEDIAGRVNFPGDATALVVFNPSAWARRDVFEAAIPSAWLPARLATADGADVPFQITAAGPVTTTIAAVADVKALGYRTLLLRPGKSAAGPNVDVRDGASEVILENDFYRVTAAKNGAGGDAITGVYDKRAGREILDRTQERGFNRFHVLMRSQAIGAGILGDDELQAFRPGWTVSKAELAENGPVRARIRVTGSYDYSLRIPPVVKTLVEEAKNQMGISVAVPVSSPVELTQDVILYKDLNRVEFTQTFHHTPPQVFENAFAYALALPKWHEVEVELPYNPIRFGGKDWGGLFDLTGNVAGDQALASRLLLQGASVFNTVFLWVEGLPADVTFRNYVDISEGDYGIAFSSRDSGVVFPTQADIAPFPDKPQPILYHLAVGPTMIGEFLLGAPTGVTYTVESALTAHMGNATTKAGVATAGTVARWARGYTAPFRAAVVTKPGGNLPAEQSFASVEPVNVIMPVLKRAEDGDGYVARLVETTGDPVVAELRANFLPALAVATVASTTEFDRCRLEVIDGAVRVPMGEHEVVTVRLRTKGMADRPPPCAFDMQPHFGCGCRTVDPTGGDVLVVGAALAWLTRRRLGRSTVRCSP